MVNENKVKMLTKLADFEKKGYRSVEELMTIGRKRYVGKGVWWTFCSATVAFILMLVIWAIYRNRLDVLFNDFTSGKTYIYTNPGIWTGYAVFVSAFVIMAFFLYNKKYSKLLPELEEYRRRRNNLEEFYTRKESQET